MERAVIFVPAGDGYQSAAGRCIEYVTSEAYQLAGVVLGDWPAVQEMMCTGRVDVVVVAAREHLPSGRTPRVEIVAEETVQRPVRLSERETAQAPRRRRPRRLA